MLIIYLLVKNKILVSIDLFQFLHGFEGQHAAGPELPSASSGHYVQVNKEKKWKIQRASLPRLPLQKINKHHECFGSESNSQKPYFNPPSKLPLTIPKNSLLSSLNFSYRHFRA